MFAAMFATSALAENILQDISFAPIAGDKVQITMKFAAGCGSANLHDGSPARIAMIAGHAQRYGPAPRRHQ